jgi:antitoxin (DNA-binding transcriptional repressor) of toxin-antitoxin stability system
MTTFTVHKAKPPLSKLIAMAERGEEVVIARGDKRAVRLTAVEFPKPAHPRRLGMFDGQFEIGPEFFEPLPEEELKAWEGK